MESAEALQAIKNICVLLDSLRDQYMGYLKVLGLKEIMAEEAFKIYLSDSGLSMEEFKNNLTLKLIDLDLPSMRLYNVLRNMGLKFVGQVVQLTEVELMKQRNFGRGTLHELKDFLRGLKLELGMLVPDSLVGDLKYK